MFFVCCLWVYFPMQRIIVCRRIGGILFPHAVIYFGWVFKKELSPKLFEK